MSKMQPRNAKRGKTIVDKCDTCRQYIVRYRYTGIKIRIFPVLYHQS